MQQMIVASLLVALFFAVFPATGSAQVKGNTPWVVLLCQPSDIPQPSIGDLDLLHRIWTEPPNQDNRYKSLSRYWSDMSYGAVSLAGTEVRGPYVLSYTQAQIGNLYNLLPLPPLWNFKSDARKILLQDCIAKANSHVDFSPFYGIAAMINTSLPTCGVMPCVDAGSAGNVPLTIGGVTPGTKTYATVTINRDGWRNLGFLGHETGHAYGLQHSWDNLHATDSSGNAGTCPGEYGDEYDIMSYSNTWSLDGTIGGPSGGPGLNAPNLLALGWIRPDQVYTYWDGTQTRKIKQTITLTALENDPNTSRHYLTAKIPVDIADVQHYLTVELRTNNGWDQGLKQNESPSQQMGAAVIVHEVTKNSFIPDPQQCAGHGYRNYVIKTDPGGLSSQQPRGNPLLYRGGFFADPTTLTGITVDRIGCGTADITIGAAADIKPPPLLPPSTVPSGLQAIPLCTGTIGLSAMGDPPPPECTGLSSPLVFERQNNDGIWTRLGPPTLVLRSGFASLEDTPPSTAVKEIERVPTAVYRACNYNGTEKTCTAQAKASVNYRGCPSSDGDGTPVPCGRPGQPICPAPDTPPDTP